MTTTTKTGKHLYIRGWLGLIPLVGGFVGIGLIALGIFKYKDNKLTLIGIVALLFTIIIYSSLFYYFQYSEAGSRQFAQTSQDFLNSLVKDIEFYKQKKGNYPDSLEQLLPNNKLVWIYDPLLSRRPGNNKTKFNYRKINDSYLLFSSGPDRTPNTKDDIYPTISLNDSSKISTATH